MASKNGLIKGQRISFTYADETLKGVVTHTNPRFDRVTVKWDDEARKPWDYGGTIGPNGTDSMHDVELKVINE